MKKKNIQIFSKVKFSKDLAIKTMKVGIKNKFKEIKRYLLEEQRMRNYF